MHCVHLPFPRTAVGLAAMIAAAVGLIAQENSRPLVQCPKVSDLVKIDGNLADPVWQETPVLTPFVMLHGDVYPKAQTEARILWNPDRLFLGIKVYEPRMAEVKAGKTDRDSGVWQDDCIEVFLMPAGAKEPFHFIVNTQGVQEDFKGDNLEWNGKWESAVGRFDGGWTLEMAIPFSELGLKGGAGQTLAFNICRERYVQAELSAYANPAGNFRNPGQFAQLVLVDKAPLWWEVQVPGEVMGDSSAIVLQARGPAATYAATVVTCAAGTEKARQNQSLQCIAGELHKWSLEFQVPGTRKPAVQLALKNQEGQVVLRTERLPLQVGDARKYELSRAKDLFGKIQKDRLPPRLEKPYAQWRERLQAFEKEPAVPGLRALSRELAIAGLLSTMTPRPAGDASALPFVVPAFTFTDYEQVPRANEVGAAVQITACRDEFEPGALNVLALEDLPQVTLQIEDLRSGTAVLPSDALDVSLVKNWYQAGEDSLMGKPVFVPELLVKDDSWCTPDHEKQRNRFSFEVDKAAAALPHWPGPDDPSQLKPVAIPAYTNRQFWILLHVPKDQTPGEYRGTIRVMNEGREILQVPLTVRVLPVTLEPTEAVFGMYNHYRHSMGKDSKVDAYYEKILALCHRYGMNSLIVQEDGLLKREGNLVTVDLSPMRKGLELRKKYGLTAHTALFGLHWFPNNGRMDTIWQMEPSEIRNDQNEVVQEFLAACREAKKIADEIGIEVSIYTYDESGYDQTGKALEQCRAQDERVHESGLKCSAAITESGARKLGKNLDVPVLSGESLAVGPRRNVSEVPYAWFYYHPLEMPFHDRVNTGLLIWYNRLQGAMPYALAALGGWDDWASCAGNYRAERYIYDGANGPIPTLQLEGFREGVDDYKYLEMIQRRCARVRKAGLAGPHAPLLTEAETLLNQPPSALSGTVSQINQKATAADFKALREQCQNLLVRLEKALAAAK